MSGKQYSVIAINMRFSIIIIIITSHLLAADLIRLRKKRGADGRRVDYHED